MGVLGDRTDGIERLGSAVGIGWKEFGEFWPLDREELRDFLGK